MEARPRNKNGTFQKGQPSPEGARRKRGSLNKITKDIREGAIAGFTRHGSNGRGEGGFAGFCYFLAKKHPKTAARIVEKLLPLTVNGNFPGLGSSVATVNILAMPSEKFLSRADMDRLTAPGIELEHQNDLPPTPRQDNVVHHVVRAEPPEYANKSTDELMQMAASLVDPK